MVVIGEIFSRDIVTPCLHHRLQVPDAAACGKMMLAEDVADCALFCINLPSHIVVEELRVRLL